MSGWRCFVAVPISERLRAELKEAVDAWRERPEADDLRWTDPAGWHLTLAFLGSTDPEGVPEIRDALARAVDEQPAFELTAGGLGAFPSARRARVAWYGIADAERRLAGLAARVRRELDIEAGPFRPHVTLGRARDERGVDLRGWLLGTEAPIGRVVVDRVELMRSHIGRGPARYETLAAVPLLVPVHA